MPTMLLMLIVILEVDSTDEERKVIIIIIIIIIITKTIMNNITKEVNSRGEERRLRRSLPSSPGGALACHTQTGQGT